MTYIIKDFDSLKGMEGFSDTLLEDHFSLYSGYVDNTNKLLDKLARMQREGIADTLEHAELRRRLGWEWNGMRLHELYFSNLGGAGSSDSSPEIEACLSKGFGNVEAWKKEFKSVGSMRGVGWVILYYDVPGERAINFWIDEHDSAHAAGGTPLVVMDVWEHSFFTDYRTAKGDYIDAFVANIDWQIVEQRLKAGKKTASLAVR